MEWINVNDRLPKEYGIVLIATEKFVSAGTRHGDYWWDRGHDTAISDENKVTHWMKLPELPCEGKKDSTNESNCILSRVIAHHFVIIYKLITFSIKSIYPKWYDIATGMLIWIIIIGMILLIGFGVL